jgi:hypothetical protein
MFFKVINERAHWCEMLQKLQNYHVFKGTSGNVALSQSTVSEL